jgi:frataxin-like iron-binding protein CyaY
VQIDRGFSYRVSCILLGLLLLIIGCQREALLDHNPDVGRGIVVVDESLIPTGSATPSRAPLREEISTDSGCQWHGIVRAWLDADGDGEWDESEAPLQGIPFSVRHQGLRFDRNGEPWFTNALGEARVSGLLPECSEKWEVIAEAISDYELTTPQLRGNAGPGATYDFGYIYTGVGRPNVVLLQSLACDVIDRPGIGGGYLSDATVAPDGSLWVSSHPTEISHFTRSGKKTIPMDGVEGTYLPPGIGLDDDGSPWFALIGRLQADAQESAYNGIASWDGAWAFFYLPEGHFNHAIPGDALVLPHGEIWLTTDKGVIAYSPSTGEWQELSREIGLLDPFVTQLILAPDEKVWLTSSLGIWHTVAPVRAAETPIWQKILFNDTGSGAPLRRLEELDISPTGVVWVRGARNNRGRNEEAVLASYNAASGEWVRYAVAGLDGEQWFYDPRSISVAPDETVWVGGPAGLVRFLPDTESWLIYQLEGGTEANRIDLVRATADGDLWISSDATYYCREQP